MPFVPKKLYYKIREVCEIIGVEAHVLRFWESEFPALSPPKTKTGQRIYRPKDIELLLEIQQLLYEEGFTIAGARKRLGSKPPAAADDGKAAEKSRPVPETAKRQTEKAPDSERLNKVKVELENILTLLDRE
jgi:DNA-binding transcriptional MerR regulator